MKRFRHNLSYYRLSGTDMGKLVPIGLVEVLPGDSFRHQTSVLARVAPLVVPVMHPIQLRIHHWYVPNRIVWDQWEDFITGKNTSLTVPQVTVPATLGSNYELADHLGIPLPPSGLLVNALPFRAYNTIWNEFYRDQDLQVKENVDSTRIKYIAWEKDYFTMARPQPQMGSAASVSVTAAGSGLVAGGSIPTGPVDPSGGAVSGTGRTLGIKDDTGAFNTVEVGKFNVEAFRVAMAQQRITEARNRFGSRYTDYLRFLGINPSDARLQRPEYLGGGKITITVSEVLATASGTDLRGNKYDPGGLKGHGIGAIRTRAYRRFFEEHGYVVSLISFRPKSVYAEAIPRHWGRKVQHDFWQKEDEALGEQPVYLREVYGKATSAASIFGWMPRHEDYRCMLSQIGGAFRQPAESAQWHMARSFTAAPVLNSSFVQCQPTDRIYADTNEPEVKLMTYHSIAARRLVSGRARNP